MSKLPTLFVKGNLFPRMGEQQDDLDKIVPIEYLMEWFNKRLPAKFGSPVPNATISDRIVILQSGTGSAKSTAIAPNLYLRFFKRYKKGIMITQPSVLTTIEIPKTIASIPTYMKPNKDGLQIELYKNLGHQTKEFVRKPITKGILFSTVGILLQYLKIMTFAEFRKKYKFILIDECHVRQIDLDITMTLLKKLVNDNINEAPFIVFMSATFDTNKYAKYFNTNTIFEVKGKSYEKIENYQLTDPSDYIQTVIDTVSNIHLNEELEYGDINDILIFVSSAGTANKIIIKLEQLNETFENLIIPIPLDSTIFKSGDANYKNLFTKLTNIKINKNNKIYSPVRRVIVSTNIAETGLTLETLKYCIDTGFMISVEHNPNYNCTILLNKAVTQSMAIQRKGRIGRVRPGIYHAMFTKDVYNSLIVDTIPSIVTEDVTLTILNIIVKWTVEYVEDYETVDLTELEQFDLSKLDLMDNIPIDSINNALEKLFILGMINKNIYPTKLGILASKFRKLKIENVKMILSGFHFKVNILDLITVASFLTIGKNKIIKKGFTSFVYDDCNIIKHKILISCEFIDFILFFNRFVYLVNRYKSDLSHVEQWCEKHFVSFKSLFQIIQMNDDIIKEVLFSLGMNVYEITTDLTELLAIENNINNTDISEIKNIKSCIYEGYKMNVASLKDNKYFTDKTNVPIKVKSYLINEKITLSNAKQLKPKKIIYNNLMLAGSSKFDFNVTDCICVLDGYIDVDDTFTIS